MKKEDQLLIVTICFLSFSLVFAYLGKWDVFLFWTLIFGIGGSIAVRQEEKKGQSKETKK